MDPIIPTVVVIGVGGSLFRWALFPGPSISKTHFGKRPTRYQVLRQMYADDVLDTAQFEQRVTQLLKMGRADDVCPPKPSDWNRPDLTMWPVPAINEEPMFKSPSLAEYY